MKNGKTLWTLAFLLLVGLLPAQRIQVLNRSAGACPGTVEACVASNQVRLEVRTALGAADAQNLPFDPNDGNPKRRFKAFWITGDGNFLEFADSPTDALSRNPPPYNYAATGDYQITTYLTGKYTNKEWPKRAAMTVRANAAPTPAPTPFTTRLRSASDLLDLYSNQAIRKKNLTAFIISYARSKQASGVYFFYNGATNTTTGQQKSLDVPLLRYANTEVPKYFPARMDTTRIRSYDALSLRFPGTVDGITFTQPFHELAQKFRNVLYFPAETAVASDMPTGFSEKRFFPVLQAHDTLIPQDTLLNFLVVLTGPEQTTTDPALNEMLSRLSKSLSTTSPINLDNQINRTDSQQSTERGAQQVPSVGGLQYIQAAEEYAVPYLVTFDPNQLTVENIEPAGSEEYKVTFRLEMCNKGQGNVLHEMVSVQHSADFRAFTSADAFVDILASAPNTWNIKVNHTIAGRPSEAHESECFAIFFTAITNCAGVRSLWSSNPDQPVESCVVFEGAIDDRPECHRNFPIDSAQFQVNGQAICVDERTAGGSDWLLWLILLLVAIIVGRKVYEDFVS